MGGLVAFLLAACAEDGPERADVPVDAAATVAGVPVTPEDFQRHLDGITEDADTLDSAALSRLFDQYLDGLLLCRLAVERGLDPSFADPARADPRHATLYLLQGVGERPWDDATVTSWYEAHSDEYAQGEQFHVRQILVYSRDDAQRALDALERGEDFAHVAARLSQGPKAHLGGDQGWLTADDLSLAFADTIQTLSVGETSDVVSTGHGFHIFQVVERAPAETRPLEDVADEIRETLRRRHVDEQVAAALDEARSRFPVRIHPETLPFDYRGSYASDDTAPDDPAPDAPATEPSDPTTDARP